MKSKKQTARKTAPKRRSPRGEKMAPRPCEECGHKLTDGECHAGCLLYNAAVAAAKAAATKIASKRSPGSTDAYLNEYGIFAWVGPILVRLGTPEEATPFVALTKAANRVKTFWSPDAPVTSKVNWA